MGRNGKIVGRCECGGKIRTECEVEEAAIVPAACEKCGRKYEVPMVSLGRMRL